MSEYTKYYNGKRYAKVNTVKAKIRAIKIKKILIKQGYNTRIENAGSRGFHIYYRKKGWK